MGAIMIEDQNEATSRSQSPSEITPERRGVVVSLAAHRRWRSESLWVGADFDHGSERVECEGTWVPEDECAEGTAVAAAQEPSLWFAIVAGISTFASIIAVYSAFVSAVRALVNLSFIYF